MMKIHFALLAAGRSLRYGKEDKLMEQIGGREILFLRLIRRERFTLPGKEVQFLLFQVKKKRDSIFRKSV